MKIEGGTPGLTGHMSKDSSLNSSGINMAAQSVVLDEPDIAEDFEPTHQEILEYAAWLGMDPEREADLLWIAKEGIKAPLPPDWKPCRSSSGDVYYFDFRTGESRWEHPADDHYKALYQQKRTEAGRGGSTKAASPGDSPVRMRSKPSPSGSPARPAAASPGQGSPKPPVPSMALGSFPLPIGTVTPKASKPPTPRAEGGGAIAEASVELGVAAQAGRIQAQVDDLVAQRIKEEVRGREADVREGVEQGVRQCVASGVADSEREVRERVEAVVRQRVEEALKEEEGRIAREVEEGVKETVRERVAEGVRAREAEVEGQVAMRMGGGGGGVQALVEQKVEELVEEGLALQEGRIKEEVPPPPSPPTGPTPLSGSVVPPRAPAPAARAAPNPASRPAPQVEARVREAVVRRTKASVDSGVAEQAGRVKEMVEEKVREKAFERVERELGKGVVQNRVEEELARRVEEGVAAAAKRGEVTGRVQEALRRRVDEKLAAAGVEKSIDDKVKQRLAIEEEKVRKVVEAEVARLVQAGVQAQQQRVHDEVDTNVCRMILEGAEAQFSQAIREGRISAGGTAKGMLEAERAAHRQEREVGEREREEMRREIEAQQERITSLEKSLEKALLSNRAASPLAPAAPDGGPAGKAMDPLHRAGVVGMVMVPAAVAAAAFVALKR